MRWSTGLAGIVALAAIVAAAAFASPDAKVTKATLYKVTIEHGTATVEATGSTSGNLLNNARNTSNEHAHWTFDPKPAQIWLVNYDGVLTSHKTEGAGSDNESDTGSIRANETFTWFNHDAPQSPLQGTSDCTGSVLNHVSVEYAAEATTGGTTFDVDLAGSFRAGETGALACDNSPAKRAVDGQPSGPSVFGFSWDPAEAESLTNQRMELGAMIRAEQIGNKSISVILDNHSNVHWGANCTALHLETCDVTFKLTGDAELTKICGGTVGAGGAPSCNGSSGGGSQPPTKKPPTTPPGGSSHNPPSISGLKVTPASFPASQAAQISYRIDETGTLTLFKVETTLKVPGIATPIKVPAEIFQHTNATKAVTFALPRSFAGHALKAGHYTLEATPVSTKTGSGQPATTTFAITS